MYSSTDHGTMLIYISGQFSLGLSVQPRFENNPAMSKCNSPLAVDRGSGAVSLATVRVLHVRPNEVT
jgi:hypothetical protein